MSHTPGPWTIDDAGPDSERELARLDQELGDWDSSEQKTLDMLRECIAKASGAGTG